MRAMGCQQTAATVTHLFCRLGVVGERRHGRRLHAPVLQKVPESLRQHPGLPGAGRSDYPGATFWVTDGRQLVWGEIGGGSTLSDGGARSRLGIPAMDDPDPARKEGRCEWPSVHIERCPVGHCDVRWAGLVGS